jgi:hypothetical protein
MSTPITCLKNHRLRSTQGLEHRLCALILTLLFSLTPAAAQEAPPPTPAEYPTWAALDTTPIPAADPLRLAQELRGLTVEPIYPTRAATRQVGEVQAFWVINESEDRTFQVEADLRVVGEHIYLWVERGVEVNPADLEAVAAEFDGRIYPAVRAIWGNEPNPGVDGDPRLYALFAYGMGPGVAAYFASRHTYPAIIYPNSNEHEMFFINLDAFGVAGLNSLSLKSTLAHEFQHMIRSRIQDNESTYLNEGYSTFTQLYLYGDANAAVWYLAQPDTQLNTWAESGNRAAHYGAAQLFITYFYDRFGLEGLQALSNHPGLGLEAVDGTLRGLGEPGVDEFVAEWVLATLLNDPTVGDGRYFYPTLPDLPEPDVVRPLREYPATVEASARQYGVDYYPLLNLEDRAQLTITLDAPPTTPLIEVQASSGQWLWYSQRGDASSTALTRAFDLTAVTSAALEYNLWFDLEDSWDYGYLQVSTDGGATWAILPTAHTTADNPHGLAYGPGYTGESRGWLTEVVPLDAYAGQHIRIRFQVITDDAINQPGMALDDIHLPQIGYSSDFEVDDGGWQAEGWVRIDNVLPQQAWVMLVQRSEAETRLDRWRTQGGNTWTTGVLPGVDSATLVIMPFAPVTTEAMRYTLSVTAG